MWFVYVLRCSDGSLYIGETNDIQRRVVRHNQGLAAAFTAIRQPVHVVYVEPHASRLEYLRSERQLKRWTRAKKEALIAGQKTLLKSRVQPEAQPATYFRWGRSCVDFIHSRSIDNAGVPLVARILSGD